MKKNNSSPEPEEKQPAAVLVAPPPVESVELALEAAKKSMYYRTELLKLIASQLNTRDVYLYSRGWTCTKCGKVMRRGREGMYCTVCGPVQGEEELEPYLSGAGCRFVLSSAGAKFEDPTIIEKRYEGTEGPYIDFEVWVTVVTKDGRCVRTMGNNATTDDFFAKRWRWVCPECDAIVQYGNGKQICAVHGQVKAKRDPYWLSLQEVDVPSIKQKAMTNAWNHAVRDLGFMPTIQHLRDAGVNVKALRRVDFSENQELAVAASAAPQGAAKAAPAEKGGKAPAGAPTPPANNVANTVPWPTKKELADIGETLPEFEPKEGWGYWAKAILVRHPELKSNQAH